MTEITKPWWMSRQIGLAVIALAMFLKSKFGWAWLPKDAAEAEEYLTMGVAIVTTFLSIRERLRTDTKTLTAGPVVSTIFIRPKPAETGSAS